MHTETIRDTSIRNRQGPAQAAETDTGAQAFPRITHQSDACARVAGRRSVLSVAFCAQGPRRPQNDTDKIQYIIRIIRFYVFMYANTWRFLIFGVCYRFLTTSLQGGLCE
jgi:hypothetical protein